jgi:hypothetical protein
MNCHFITNTVISRVSTKLINDFVVLTVNSSVRSSPSVRCSNAASTIYKLSNGFDKITISLEDYFSFE